MNLKISSFEEMALEIGMKKKVYIFGAGMIGKVVVPEILKQYDLMQYLSGYIDNNDELQGKSINVGGNAIAVKSLMEVCAELKNSVLIMAVSRFNAVVDQLTNVEGIENASCYLFPMMCISNFKEPQIPKIIHYMWLGKKELPDLLKRCMESWQKYCPDYHIQRWDESNYDIEKNLYMKNAYKEGKYGFVPDYARLDILYQYGGIYMDTDIELIKPLDDLLGQDSFCGVEKWQTINFGGCSGAVKGSRAIEKFLEARQLLTFYDESGHIDTNTCGYYDTLTALKYGYQINGQKQKVMGMTIYPSDYFHPYDYMSGMLEITHNTYSIHHFNGGWLDKGMREENSRAKERYIKICEVAEEST